MNDTLAHLLPLFATVWPHPVPCTLSNQDPAPARISKKKREPGPGLGPGNLKFMTPGTAPVPVFLSTPVGSYLKFKEWELGCATIIFDRGFEEQDKGASVNRMNR